MFQYFYAFILGGFLIGPVLAAIADVPFEGTRMGLVGGIIGVVAAVLINRREGDA